jgi:hypothetical protein
MIGLPRTYQSEGSVVLLASRAASKPNGDNPYLSFNPSLTLTADVLSRELMAPATVSGLASRGFPDSYSVALATYTTQTTGSVLLITVSGSGKAVVGRTLGGVISEIGARLATLQSGIKPNDKIRAVTLSATRATLEVSQTVRPLVALVGLGLAASLGIPWFVDTQVRRRQIARVPDPRAAGPPRPAGRMAEDSRGADPRSVSRGFPREPEPAGQAFTPTHGAPRDGRRIPPGNGGATRSRPR